MHILISILYLIDTYRNSNLINKRPFQKGRIELDGDDVQQHKSGAEKDDRHVQCGENICRMIIWEESID